MINRTVMVGRLTKDPVLGQTGTGVAYCRFTIAITRPFSGNNGEKETDFIPCVAWKKQAENLCAYMKKGSLIGVEGRMQSGRYQNNEQKTIYTLDLVADSIQFYDSRGSGSNSDTSQQNSHETSYGNQSFSGANQQFGGNSNQQFGGSQQYTGGGITVNEDNLPF